MGKFWERCGEVLGEMWGWESVGRGVGKVKKDVGKAWKTPTLLPQHFHHTTTHFPTPHTSPHIYLYLSHTPTYFPTPPPTLPHTSPHLPLGEDGVI